MSEYGEQLGLFKTRDGFPQPSQSRILGIEKLAVDIVCSRGLKVKVVKWKNNRRVMASVGKHGVLNLHTIYQRASEPDLKALANVMSGKAKQSDHDRFQQYIQKNLPRELDEGKSRLVVMPARGLFHNLDEAMQRLLPLLDRPLDPIPNLGWSPVRVGRHGITWGTHRDTVDGPLILVNAVLDAPGVPNYVVEHIVWHELCHQVVPPENGDNGRRKVHNGTFKEFEERYPRLKEAETWEQTQVAKLIRRHYRRR
jgi:hypothetical protein